MKKVILSLIAACAMTTGFAQFNTAILNQTGNSQQARIRQDGRELRADVYQQDGDGMGGNQTETRQSGYNESIRVGQSGTYNEAYLTQLQESADAYLRQIGTQNLVNSVQRGNGRTYAVGDFYQDGTSNQITLDQREDGIYEYGTSAVFYQYGLDNKAFVTQRGGDNSSRVEQDGANNTAGLSQDGTANLATFSQRGDTNTIQGLSGGSQASQAGSFNALEIHQTGSYQNASVGQNGYTNTGYISQTDGYK